jgi:hypothetical protein
MGETNGIILHPTCTNSGFLGDTVAFSVNHVSRAAFAHNVAIGNYVIQPACLTVLGNPTIAGEATNGTAGNTIPDSDIQFAVNSLWNLLAGA